MNEFALNLLRLLGQVIDRLAQREPAAWREIVRTGGGDPAMLTPADLENGPDTTALATALAAEPDPPTESWVLDALGALGLGIADFVRFAADVESRTGASDVAWLALERQAASDFANWAPPVADVLSLLDLLERFPLPDSSAEPGETGDDWAVGWSSLRHLVEDPGVWLDDTVQRLPSILPLALNRLLAERGIPVRMGEPRPDLAGAVGDAGIDASGLLAEVSVGLPPLVDDGTVLLTFEALAAFFADPGGGPSLAGFLVGVQSNGAIRETLAVPVTDELEFSVSVSTDARALAGLGFAPDLFLFARAAGAIGLEAGITWRPAPPAADSGSELPVVPVLERFEATVGLSGEAASSGALNLTARIGFEAEGEIRFDVGSALPMDVVDAALVVPWSVSLGWDSGRPGHGLEGSFSLRSPPLPTLTLGPLTVEGFTIGFELGGEEGRLDFVFGVGLELGPLTVRAAGLGAFGSLPLPAASDEPRSGPTFGFIPPNALEISADNPPMLRGGGAIIFGDGVYSGFLSLQVYELAVTALGLVEVDLLPPGPDFSLFVLVSAQFPGIQVGYGFTINGLGGMVGIYRTIDADALRGDVSSGSVSAILDPGSEMDRAIELLARMARYFPTRADRFVIGLSVQLRWVELVRVDIGVLIELPGPAKIVILGRARIALEADDVALIRIQLDVLGIIDFEEKLLSIDAALTDSCILEIFDITGGAAVRLSWGDRPYVVLSIGGFHPEFVPEPAVVPVPARVGVSTGGPDDWFYLRLQTYFAVTTSSLQLGAAVEVRVDLEVILIEGGLGFDALIVFDPFYFSIAFYTSFRIKLAGISLAGVSMRGTMTGPGPVTFAGEVTLEILFISVSWTGSFSIGSEATLALSVIDSVLDRVMEQLGGATARPVAALRPGAVLRSTDDTVAPLDPAGGVEWTQGLVPLGVLVERIEGSPLARPLEIRVLEAEEFLRAYDLFAAASFAELTDAEALTRKTFERLEAGFAVDGRLRILEEDGTVERALEAEVFVWPRAGAAGTASDLPSLPPAAEAALRRRGGIGVPDSIDPVLGLREESWTVTSGDPADPAPPLSETAAHQRARYDGGVALPAGDAVTAGDI